MARYPDSLTVWSIKLDNPYATDTGLIDGLKLPELDAFHYGPLDLPELPEESVISTEPEPLEQIEEDVDIWDLASIPLPLSERPRYLTWRRFQDINTEEDNSLYLSEWGTGAFDSALKKLDKAQNTKKPYSLFQSNIIFKALYDLGLGRSSLFYEYDDSGKAKALVRGLSVSGISPELFISLERKVSNCGSSIRHLRYVSDKEYTSSTFPARVALANCISKTLSVVESYLSACWNTMKSWIGLQYTYSKVEQLLNSLVELAKDMNKAHSDEDLASMIFIRCQNVENEVSWLHSIMLEILSRVCGPLLNKINSWTGLCYDPSLQLDPQTSDLSFITSQNQDDTNKLEYSFQAQDLPTFLTLELGQTIFDTGRNLRLLQHHQPESAISSPSTSRENALEWAFQWPDVDAIINKAHRYEKLLADTVRGYSTNQSKSGSTSFPTDKRDPAWLSKASDDDFLESIGLLSETPSTMNRQSDKLHDFVQHSLEAQDHFEDEHLGMAPPLSLVPQLSFEPLLRAQARLIKGACLRLAFRSHNLRHHLRLQRAFHLMGDGVFVSQISAALFDSSAQSTERKRGVMRSGTGMGLNLTDRQSWPPASSELRLALMGILSNCYTSLKETQSAQGQGTGRSQHLPGSMSFAIRNLPEAEIQRILDPTSLYALDFLRLQYLPSSPLDQVITTLALEKYDLIFKFLLRLIRLLFSVSRLPRKGVSPATHRFIFEARTFMNTCTSYFFDTVIGLSWADFESYLDRVEKSMADEDTQRPEMMRDLGGIDELRKAHEACLDKMLFGMFLRQRQIKVLVLLEEIFTTILQLEVLCHKASPEDEIKELHRTFDAKVRLFVEVCKGLSGERMKGVASGTENMLIRLLMALDFNGFYASQPSA
jgi:gamma-tubulin complex component